MKKHIIGVCILVIATLHLAFSQTLFVKTKINTPFENKLFSIGENIWVAGNCNDSSNFNPTWHGFVQKFSSGLWDKQTNFSDSAMFTSCAGILASGNNLRIIFSRPGKVLSFVEVAQNGDSLSENKSMNIFDTALSLDTLEDGKIVVGGMLGNVPTVGIFDKFGNFLWFENYPFFGTGSVYIKSFGLNFIAIFPNQHVLCMNSVGQEIWNMDISSLNITPISATLSADSVVLLGNSIPEGEVVVAKLDILNGGISNIKQFGLWGNSITARKILTQSNKFVALVQNDDGFNSNGVLFYFDQNLDTITTKSFKDFSRTKVSDMIITQNSQIWISGHTEILAPMNNAPLFLCRFEHVLSVDKHDLVLKENPIYFDLLGRNFGKFSRKDGHTYMFFE